MNPTRAEEDFAKAVEALASTDSGASRIFVCEGINTHKLELPVRFALEACSMIQNLIKREARYCEKRGKPGWFPVCPHHRIRFVYTPKHSSWMNQIEIWFGIINRKLPKRKSYISIGELEKIFSVL